MVLEPSPEAYFTDLSRGAVLVYINSRRLAFWDANENTYRVVPIGVPSTPELEWRGDT